MLRKIIYILIYNILNREVHKRNKKGLLLSIFKKVSINNKKRHTTQPIKIKGSTIQYIDSESFLAMYKEIFEHEIYNFNSKSDSPNIIDCGANIGLSILFFKQKYPKAKITAFEADPMIYKILKSNIRSLNLKEVFLHQKAVWSEETSIPFSSDHSDGGHISRNEESFSVDTVKLSNFINKKVDLLKIDIEGAELEVLEECQDKLHFVEHLFVEYHSFKGQDQNLNIILNILSSNGFRFYIDNLWHFESPFVDKLSETQHDNLLNIFAWK